MNTRLIARLKGNVCFITVDGNGNVTGSQAPLTVTGDGVVKAEGQTLEVSSKDSIRDPAAPAETEQEAAARVAKERQGETPEQKTARETAEAATTAEATRRAALTEEQRVAEDKVKEAEASTAEATAKDKAWAERDVTKDVIVTAEQKAEIAKLASTPEQVALMEKFTLETNTTNDLSPASRAEAAKAWGVTPAMVDQYVASVIATNKGAAAAAVTYDDTSDDQSKWSPQLTEQFNLRMNALYEVAGGKDNWNEFSTWADANLKPEAMSALQAAISASPVVGATVAKSMMQAWKAQGNGGGPLDLSRGTGVGARPAAAGAVPFASKAEQNAAIQNPSYAKDPAYRASVDARMVISNFSANQEQRLGAMM